MQIPSSPQPSIAVSVPNKIAFRSTCGDDPLGWMRRRLRTTLCLGAMLLALQTLSAIATPSQADRKKRQASERLVSSVEVTPRRTGRAVLPVGWRRTSKGWEHVSTWGPKPVNELTLSQRIIAQRESEPAWLQTGLAKIRRTPPGCFAMAQLLAVGILFLIPRDHTCPRPVR